MNRDCDRIAKEGLVGLNRGNNHRLDGVRSRVRSDRGVEGWSNNQARGSVRRRGGNGFGVAAAHPGCIIRPDLIVILRPALESADDLTGCISNVAVLITGYVAIE